MGYKLRPVRSIVSPYDGSANTTAYAIIDDVTISKRDQKVYFTLAIYANRSARLNGLRALDTHPITASGADFVTYFSPSLTTTIWAQAQAYLLAKGLVSTPLVAADWMIDPLDAGGEP